MFRFSFDHTVLNSFPLDSHSLLKTMLFSQEGMLSADQVEELAGLLSCSPSDLPERLLPVAAACAMPEVSGFHVGVVVRGGSGALYMGANLEYSDSFLGMSLHGEQSAITNAWSHGEQSITHLVVNAAPCGLCRQFLHELGYSDQLEVKIVDGHGHSHHACLEHYLPEAFGPSDLGVDGGILSSAAASLVPAAADADRVANDSLIQTALAEACLSYAPYSKGYAAVALETTDGDVVCGRYAENAAYNPSLQPFTAAFSRLRFQKIGQDVQLKRVVLVEAESPVRHATHMAALAQALQGVSMDHITVRLS